MALVLGTDTYIELDEASEYLTNYGADGDAVTESELRRATLAIDRLYGARFTGTRTSSTQALQFPRDGSDEFPTALQHATVELALLISAGTDPYVQPNPLVTKESTKVDVLETSYEYASATASDPLYKIALILSPLMYAKTAIATMDVVRA